MSDSLDWSAYYDMLAELPRAGCENGHIGFLISYKFGMCDDECLCHPDSGFGKGATWDGIMKAEVDEAVAMEYTNVYW